MKKNVKALTLLSVFLLLLFLFGCTKEEQSRPMNVDVITSADGKTYTVKNGCEKVHFSVGDGKPCQVEITVNKPKKNRIKNLSIPPFYDKLIYIML